MLDGKFLITLVGLVVAAIAICNADTSKVPIVSEAFGMNPAMGMKLSRMAAPSAAAAQRGDFYSVPVSYQAALNPRFSNVGYGANINYNMPSQKHLASPADPLMLGNMVSKNYSKCGISNSVAQNVGAPHTAPGFADGNYNDILSGLDRDPSSALPVGDMTSVNAAGDTNQPIIYDRLILANKNSRTRGQGDWIRGDLVPTSAPMVVSTVAANPTLDLNQGAMNVLVGQSEAGDRMSAFMFAASGQASTAIAGADMSSQLFGSVSNGTDVTMSACN